MDDLDREVRAHEYDCCLEDKIDIENDSQGQNEPSYQEEARLQKHFLSVRQFELFI